MVQSRLSGTDNSSAESVPKWDVQPATAFRISLPYLALDRYVAGA